MLYLLVDSGNDAAIALAEAFGKFFPPPRCEHFLLMIHRLCDFNYCYYIVSSWFPHYLSLLPPPTSFPSPFSSNLLLASFSSHFSLSSSCSGDMAELFKGQPWDPNGAIGCFVVRGEEEKGRESRLQVFQAQMNRTLREKTLCDDCTSTVMVVRKGRRRD
eukprot:763243-Hanusia_phi.AAC.2